MNTQKTEALAKLYQDFFKNQDIPAKRMSSRSNAFLCKREEIAMPHCHWMSKQIPVLLRRGQYDKAHRWLGWIQASLWWRGHFSLSELKKHSKEI